MRADHPEVPFDCIEVVLLDVGGTLMSMDFTWAHRELLSRSILCTPAQLERAEAAARPAASRENETRLARGEAPLDFERFLTHWFQRLQPIVGASLEPASPAFLAHLQSGGQPDWTDREAVIDHVVALLRVFDGGTPHSDERMMRQSTDPHATRKLRLRSLRR